MRTAAVIQSNSMSQLMQFRGPLIGYGHYFSDFMLCRPISATRWQQCFLPLLCCHRIMSNSPWHCSPHLPVCNALTLSHIRHTLHWVSSISCFPTESYHFKNTFIPLTWDSVNTPIKIIHYWVLQSLNHAVFICVAWNWWSKPYEEMSVSAETQWTGRPPTACSQLSFSLSFPPRFRQHSFVALGISAEEAKIIQKELDTRAYATFIYSAIKLEH